MAGGGQRGRLGRTAAGSDVDGAQRGGLGVAVGVGAGGVDRPGARPQPCELARPGAGVADRGRSDVAVSGDWSRSRCRAATSGGRQIGAAATASSTRPAPSTALPIHRSALTQMDDRQEKASIPPERRFRTGGRSVELDGLVGGDRRGGVPGGGVHRSGAAGEAKHGVEGHVARLAAAVTDVGH